MNTSWQKLLFVLSFFLLFFVLNTPVHASELYLSPANGSIYQGVTSYIQIRLNTQGQPINAVSTDLSYPSDKITVVGLSYGGSFSIAAEGGYGGGYIHLSRGSFSEVSGDVTVATIAVQGLVLGSSESISFTGGSHAVSAVNSSETLTGSSGGNYTTTVAPTQAPIIGPRITEISTSNVATNSAVISWKTDLASDSEVSLGLLANQYAITLSSDSQTKNHRVLLLSPLIIPGETYHMQVISKTEDGGETRSNDMLIQFLGYRVMITVLNNFNSPISNTSVTLYSYPIQSKTDSHGVAEFRNATAGKHILVIHEASDLSQEITVATLPINQSFTLKVAASETSQPIFQLLLFLIVITLLFVERDRLRSLFSTKYFKSFSD